MNYFVVSDIHGCLDNFNEVLKNFNSSTQQLVLVGDYVDRGPNSIGVLKRIKELKEQYPTTVVLMGNHDEMFLKFVMDKMDLNKTFDYLDEYGGKVTVESFTGEMLDTCDIELVDKLKRIRSDMMLEIKELINFLTNDLQYYYETENILFTHAGYNAAVTPWTKTTKEQYVWIRYHYKNRPTTHHVNVFGHTPTCSIREEKGEGYSFNPLFIEHVKGAYLAIDGACAYGGQLNAVLLNDEGKILNTYISG